MIARLKHPFQLAMADTYKATVLFVDIAIETLIYISIEW